MQGSKDFHYIFKIKRSRSIEKIEHNERERV